MRYITLTCFIAFDGILTLLYPFFNFGWSRSLRSELGGLRGRCGQFCRDGHGPPRWDLRAEPDLLRASARRGVRSQRGGLF